jgi:NADH-quinone oxidoreductase subunit M
MFFIVASLGMPGLGNFVGEFLVLLGTFQVSVTVTVVAALGLVTAAIYALIAMQRVFQGPSSPGRGLVDFGAREISIMVAMMAGLVFLGVYPQPIFDTVSPVLASLHELSGVHGIWIGGGK